ncbi:MAG TPA: hypothetical protein HPQ00_02100, partial [Magnetococcales bacterium]|nr:hypothetical protein [Magnetococcales bacterium]
MKTRTKFTILLSLIAALGAGCARQHSSEALLLKADTDKNYAPVASDIGLYGGNPIFINKDMEFSIWV